MKVSNMVYLKDKYGYSYDKLSELSGVPKGTIQKIFSGVTRTPRYDTLAALERALTEGSKTGDPSDDNTGGYTYDMDGFGSEIAVNESFAYNAVPKKKKYTLEDYYALPDEPRMELIDGDFFVMDAPSAEHQIIVFQICHQIENFIEENDGDCVPFVSPCDVQLDCDEFTMVQPDVFVICDKSKYKKKNIYGAPEFVVEVLSPSTTKKDMNLKLFKYSNAGVREYWLVSPEKKKVFTYVFNSNIYGDESLMNDIGIYTFEDKIPVAIYDGRLEIDFSRINKRINAMEGQP